MVSDHEKGEKVYYHGLAVPGKGMTGKKLLLVIVSISHQTAYDVNRYREDNGTVLLCGNTVQRLKVSQLQQSFGVRETQLLRKE